MADIPQDPQPKPIGKQEIILRLQITHGYKGGSGLFMPPGDEMVEKGEQVYLDNLSKNTNFYIKHFQDELKITGEKPEAVFDPESKTYRALKESTESRYIISAFIDKNPEKNNAAMERLEKIFLNQHTGENFFMGTYGEPGLLKLVKDYQEQESKNPKKLEQMVQTWEKAAEAKAKADGEQRANAPIPVQPEKNDDQEYMKAFAEKNPGVADKLVEIYAANHSRSKDDLDTIIAAYRDWDMVRYAKQFTQLKEIRGEVAAVFYLNEYAAAYEVPAYQGAKPEKESALMQIMEPGKMIWLRDAANGGIVPDLFKAPNPAIDSDSQTSFKVDERLQQALAHYQETLQETITAKKIDVAQDPLLSRIEKLDGKAGFSKEEMFATFAALDAIGDVKVTNKNVQFQLDYQILRDDVLKAQENPELFVEMVKNYMKANGGSLQSADKVDSSALFNLIREKSTKLVRE